jgi:hypothetical protein
MGAFLMSLRAAFEYWCKHNGYVAKTATYITDGATGLDEGTARIMRGVKPADRAVKHRNPQKYAIEAMVNDAFTYPLGNKWVTKQELLAAMVADTMKGKDNE